MTANNFSYTEGSVSSPASCLHPLSLALEKMDEIKRRAVGKKVVMFLDYDGTLTPIVDRPELAILSQDMRTVLHDIASQWIVAIISGRDLSDLRQRVGVEGIFYAGSHGFDIDGPDGWEGQHQRGREFLPTLDRVERDLRKRLISISGALIERKAFSLAVHYRLVMDEEVALVERVVDDVLSKEPDLRKICGKKVYELQPDIDWNKGKAVIWLLDTLNLATDNVVPFYIGDDVTDWDAFSVLRDRGVGILVHDTPQPCAAHYILKNPQEVHLFLVKLFATLKHSSI